MKLDFIDLDMISYKDGLDYQELILKDTILGKRNASVIICRHYPVITLGRKSRIDDILCSEDVLKEKGILLHMVKRGGNVTYHGPGQLTVYPIFNLNFFKKDVHWFLWMLEEIAIEFLSSFSVKAIRIKDLRGVWVSSRKICSIGIAIKNWVSFHGLSINIGRDDLTNFNMIKPCGMDIQMTSLEDELGFFPKYLDLKDRLCNSINNVFA